nr:diguanylate cyclase [uncultured Tyzzerella sp.]
MILDDKGEILGASENIDEDFKRNSKRVFNIIKNGAADSIIEIEGNDYYTASMEYKDYMIIGGVDTKSLYKYLQWYILSIILCMILICVLGIVLLDRVLDKNIICNIKEIISVINKIEKGNFNVRIEEKGCLELVQIESAINNMINVLINMSNRLEKVVISTNLPLGLFEYMPNLNQILITNNVKEILSINEYEWEEVKTDSELCKNLLLQIEQNPVQGEPNTYIFNNKFIKLNLILEEKAYFGFIEDVTTEMIKKDNMLNELKREQIKSKIDTLTGLLNKGAITNIVTEYADKNNKGTLLLFDLDNFKKVNDTKGHPEGDRLLKVFSNTIKDLFSQEDYVARFGGDEFAVFICGNITDEDLTKKLDLVINKVREELKDYYENFHLSVSIGAGSLSDEIDTFEKLYELADRRLYVAKNNGKDNYCIK